MSIQLKKLSKSFSGLEVFDKLQLSIEDNEFVAILGPSGCGKTTLLNLIAGIEKPDFGEIKIDSHSEFQIGYMLQEVLLLPWRTLSENALLGAEILFDNKSVKKKQLDEYFSSFDLGDSKLSYPSSASGGMKRRAALIRTLLIEPSLLLLDEPFVDLDFDIRLKIQRQLIQNHKKNKTTVLLVTHDIEDAIALADTVFVLSEKPTRIKSEIKIELGTSKKDPIKARKSPKFRKYFAQIWDELKYLDNNG